EQNVDLLSTGTRKALVPRSLPQLLLESTAPLKVLFLAPDLVPMFSFSVAVTGQPGFSSPASTPIQSPQS
ncbi:hypothetical protein P7K49_005343, partial [Saguinus oedipus]